MKLGLTAQQHRQRRAGIGGSDAGSIVAGGEEWVKLWRVKTGRAEPEDLTGELRVMMGLATEPFNRFWYTKQTKRPVTRAGQLQRHPEIPYLACTLDGESSTSGGFRAAWQAKHVGKSGEAMQLRYTSQGTHEALCLGTDWYVLSVFVANSKWELHECEIDPFFASEYLEKAAEFWSYVERDTEPPEVGPLPVPPPKRLRIVQLEDAFREDWPNWGAEMAGYIRTFAETKATADLHHLTREQIKRLTPEDVGTITRGRFTLKKATNGVIRMSLAELDDDE